MPLRTCQSKSTKNTESQEAQKALLSPFSLRDAALPNADALRPLATVFCHCQQNDPAPAKRNSAWFTTLLERSVTRAEGVTERFSAGDTG